MGEKSATVKDIANHLGISLSTVNKALTGKPGVSEKRRGEVLKAARDMGYRVNFAAQSLSRRPIVVGVIIPSIWRPFWDDAELGMMEEFSRLKQFNVSHRFIYAKSKPETENAFLMLIQEKVDAIVYCHSMFILSAEVCATINGSAIPVFISGGEYDGIDAVSTVCVNGAMAGHMAADIMRLSLPRNARVAVFTCSKEIKIHTDKVQAFVSWIAEGGFQLAGVYETQDDEAIVDACVKKLYRDCPDVRGVYVTSTSSLPVLRYVETLPEADRPVVVGTDIYPALRDAIQNGVAAATVHQNQRLMGRMAVKLCYEYLLGANSYQDEKQEIEKRVYVNPQLYLKSSLAATGFFAGPADPL